VREPATSARRAAILAAAVRVFAREGFHACRVSDIAAEAQVGYGLVYHYFPSKEALLDTIFLERWEAMLDAIRAIDAREPSARAKLAGIASFIFESYRHEPDLMKVIIVEVTRAANSFGARHLAQIREAYALIGEILERGIDAGEVHAQIEPRFAAMAFYGIIEQVLTGWIFGLLPTGTGHFDRAKQSAIELVFDGLGQEQRAERRGGA
jgi:AcrR family transcriptional regulator